MANPSFKYTIALCLIALALFHVHDAAETETSSKVVLEGHMKKINSEYQVEMGGRCELKRPYGGDYLWCCNYGEYENCFDEKWECDSYCREDGPRELNP